MNFVTEENLLRLKTGLYGGLLFFSFFTIIAVPVTTNNIGGCFLYAGGSLASTASNCNYAIAMAVIFGMLYALFRLALLVLLLLGKLNTEFVLLTDLFQLIYTAVDAVAWFLVFISACILSAGINSTCNNFPGSIDCSDRIVNGDDSAVSRMHTAEAGAWISFILWLVLVATGVFWLFRQGKLPFVSGPAKTDGGPTATAPAPNMETPPAAGDDPTKY